MEYIELIRQAYKADRVDLSIYGDLEDIEIGLGLRKKRSKPYDQGRWSILSQILPSFEKLGRNDPCPCGSGKKYKKCCLD